jgi:hypothetical protein
VSNFGNRQGSDAAVVKAARFAMTVAKQVGDQRDALWPIPGNTRFGEFFSVFAASVA